MLISTHCVWTNRLTFSAVIMMLFLKDPPLLLAGGSGLDRDHLITSGFTADREMQYWDIEVV